MRIQFGNNTPIHEENKEKEVEEMECLSDSVDHLRNNAENFQWLSIAAAGKNKVRIKKLYLKILFKELTLSKNKCI